jgi:hypothetical protein
MLIPSVRPKAAATSGTGMLTAAVMLVMLALPMADAGANDDVTSVPALLAVAAQKEGEVVAVAGYLRPHVLYLFPSRALAEAQDWKSSLIIGDDPTASIRSSPCPDHFVTITGTFRQLDPGIHGLTDISRIELASSGDVCWPVDAGPAR